LYDVLQKNIDIAAKPIHVTKATTKLSCMLAWP